jgi:hypothetical protein
MLVAGATIGGYNHKSGARAANLRSRALATGLGYWPAWTDLYARDR